jgi:hypothetical protein
VFVSPTAYALSARPRNPSRLWELFTVVRQHLLRPSSLTNFYVVFVVHWTGIGSTTDLLGSP